MTVKEFKELKKQHYILDCEVEDVFNFVEELLLRIARETEEREPYAVSAINRLDQAAHEVWNLIDYVSELEEE